MESSFDTRGFESSGREVNKTNLYLAGLLLAAALVANLFSKGEAPSKLEKITKDQFTIEMPYNAIGPYKFGSSFNSNEYQLNNPKTYFVNPFDYGN